MASTESFLQEVARSNPAAVPSLGAWCTVPTLQFTAWMRPGGMADTRADLILLLRQLQQKVHYAVQHGTARPARAAIVRTPEHKRSDGELVARLIMLEDVNDSPKNCYMWVCPRSTVEEVHQRQRGMVCEAGSLHVVIGMSNVRGNQLILQPSLDPSNVPEGTDVCVVQLTDIHEYIFLYHAIALACRSRATASALQLAHPTLLHLFDTSPPAPAFHSWLGTANIAKVTPVWNELLGLQRDPVFEFAQSRLGIVLTDKQKQLIRSLQCTLTVINNDAGGGKTTLTVIALYCVHQVQQAGESSRPLIFSLAQPSVSRATLWKLFGLWLHPELWQCGVLMKTNRKICCSSICRQQQKRNGRFFCSLCICGRHAERNPTPGGPSIWTCARGAGEVS